MAPDIDSTADQAKSQEQEHVLAAAVVFAPGQPIMYFRRDKLNVVPGDMVVARLERGIDLGRVTRLVSLPADQAKSMRPLLRRATDRDLRRRQQQDSRRQDALRKCQQKIAEHGLPMRLIDCYYTLDGRRLVFYFAAEGRVDFRALVRDLARMFRCRIELRQVGVRDHAKLLGGIGPCGRPLCCAQFLHSFDPVSIRMAKEQGLALNPAKLSGLCNRLMCCLLFERDTYEELGRDLPRVGDTVPTPRGAGKVEAVNVLSRRITVHFEEGGSAVFDAAELVEAQQAEADSEIRSEGEQAPRGHVGEPARGAHRQQAAEEATARRAGGARQVQDSSAPNGARRATARRFHRGRRRRRGRRPTSSGSGDKPR